MPQKLILDVDTGTDDAVALMCAALHPALELVAATTVAGNTGIEYTTENTLRVLDHIGARIPVYRGMATPLARHTVPGGRTDDEHVVEIHGRYLDIPAARSKAQVQHAVSFLSEYYLGPTGPETILVAVGPLTNIAAALKKEPRLAERIPELVIIGGAHEVGNITPAAEFNFWCDPEAASVVFGSSIGRITHITTDATHQVLTSLDDCATLRASGTPAATAAAVFTERRIHAYDAGQPMARPHTTPVHDALAVLALVDREMIRTVHVHVDIETGGAATVGRCVIDTHHRGKQPPNAHVALWADESRFIPMMLETLTR
ncbi:MAG: nucleoside hydrolase [Anaerolineae bacterium]|nr:nucleoside hydrolase [Anaerolineae bacterium]